MNELEGFEFPHDKPFGLRIIIDGVKYEFYIHLKSTSDKLICMGSGARDPDFDRSRPFFNRWSRSNEIKESVLHYNDPTSYLSEDMIGGWGVGLNDDYYLETISKIILKFSECLNIRRNHLLFYGSSIGGFTSLILATLIKDSYALSDIPQLDLTHYDKEHYDRIMKYCFHNISENEVLEKYGERINVIKMMKKQNYIPKAILLFDCSYLKDMTRNYIPFFNQLNELSYSHEVNKLQIVIHGRNIGHKPLSQESVVQLFNNFFDLKYDDFNRIL